MFAEVQNHQVVEAVATFFGLFFVSVKLCTNDNPIADIGEKTICIYQTIRGNQESCLARGSEVRKLHVGTGHTPGPESSALASRCGLI